MEQKNKEPKDLGIKIGTKAQVLWETVKKNTLVEIEANEKELIVHKAMLLMAEKKIDIEKEKFKKK